MNSLQDQKMIQKLYDASQAGVKIKLIVRGICCLVPGIEGYSENIEITSIVGRYLEHARVYIFHNNGNEAYYVASADWMSRNLSRRVEVAFPILAAEHRQELRRIIDLQLADNVKARIINYKQSNAFVAVEEGEERIDAQQAIYNMLAEKVTNPKSKPI